ncbi:MAG: NPCBM/NEW2 domain-containing protein [Planctomycetia bacterium]|nr:NPCBM/NEW2 domain-containing protein [Planctomycetia bacterium]
MWAILLATVLSADPEVTAQTLDGRSISGKLSQLDGSQAVIQSAAGPVAVAVEQLVGIQPAEERGKPGEIAAYVQLTDGSRLSATQYTAQKTTSRFVFLGATVQAPTGSVAVVRFREPTDPIAAQWQELLQAKVAGDLVVLRKAESIDYLEGALADVTPETVHFEVEGKTAQINRDRVDGLVYLRRNVELPDATCVVADVDGSVLFAKTMKLENGKLLVETPAGLSATLAWDKVLKLDYSAGKVLFLADAAADSTKVSTWIAQNIPVLLKWRQPRSNHWGRRGSEVIPLKLRGEVYEKGLALRSRTELMYRLRGKYRRFQAVAGIDDEVEGLGHVRLVIQGDGKTLYDEAIAGSDKPKTLDVDVSGVNQLVVLVDFGEGGDTSDYLDLCEARVTK